MPVCLFGCTVYLSFVYIVFVSKIRKELFTYFGGLADFSASANIKSVIILATGILNVITHVDQVASCIVSRWRYVTRMRLQDATLACRQLCLPCQAGKLNMRMRP